MRNVIKTIGIWLYILGCLVVGSVFAQDVHFTQYTATPVYVNPAMSGFHGSNYRVGANFRTQWNAVSSGNTYRTFNVFSDFALGKPTYYSNYAGIGINFYSDQAGDLNYSTNKVDLNVAYHFILDNKGTNSISAGIQSGFGMRSIDLTNAVFANQGGGIDPLGGEAIDRERYSMYDVGMGFLWSYSPDKDRSFYLGTAMHHLNQPELSQFTSVGASDRMYAKFSVMGGMQVPAGERIHIQPSFIVHKQGPSTEINLSALMSYSFNREPFDQNSVAFGVMYRGPLDALALLTRINLETLAIGFSYDVNISSLSSASRSNGGPEISLVYIGKPKNRGSERYCIPF